MQIGSLAKQEVEVHLIFKSKMALVFFPFLFFFKKSPLGTQPLKLLKVGDWNGSASMLGLIAGLEYVEMAF